MKFRKTQACEEDQHAKPYKLPCICREYSFPLTNLKVTPDLLKV